jgi:MerR family transcriptional regulator/heat shock protein HspR
MSHHHRLLFTMSVAAELTGVQPQTLRTYERKGLVHPARSRGGARRYSRQDVARVQRITELTAAGINLAGVIRLGELFEQGLGVGIPALAQVLDLTGAEVHEAPNIGQQVVGHLRHRRGLDLEHLKVLMRGAVFQVAGFGGAQEYLEPPVLVEALTDEEGARNGRRARYPVGTSRSRLGIRGVGTSAVRGTSTRNCMTSAVQGVGGRPGGNGACAPFVSVRVCPSWPVKSTTTSARSPGERTSGPTSGTGRSSNPPLALGLINRA